MPVGAHTFGVTLGGGLCGRQPVEIEGNMTTERLLAYRAAVDKGGFSSSRPRFEPLKTCVKFDHG